MATYRYQVKSTDNYPNLAQKLGVPLNNLLKVNNNNPLSAGLVIKVPKYKGAVGKGGFTSPLAVAPMQPGMDLQNPYNNVQPAFGGSFTSGSGKVNYPMTSGVFPRSQGPFVNTQQAAPVLTQGSFVSGSGGVNMAQANPSMGGRGTMLPTAQDYATAGSILGPQPTGTYTGGNSANDQAWRDLWNQQAANPPPPSGEFPGFWGGGKNGGFYKTLREARMATRRKRTNEREQDNASRIYSPPAVEVRNPQARTDTVTWNVG